MRPPDGTTVVGYSGPTPCARCDEQTPFATWPAPPAGQTQVNINYAESALKGTGATGTGIWIASLVFHVDAAFGSSAISLSLSNGGNIVTNGATETISDQVGLGANIGSVGSPSRRPCCSSAWASSGLG